MKNFILLLLHKLHVWIVERFPEPTVEIRRAAPQPEPEQNRIRCDLKLWRLYADAKATIGVLFWKGFFLCFTLEDEHRDVKVPKETRIPAGIYKLELRDSPTHSKKYGHQMIYVNGVPTHTGIMFHIGSFNTDTDGCILVGLTPDANNIDGELKLTSSRTAYYKVFYPVVHDALKNGDVFLEVVDEQDVAMLVT